MATYKTTVRMVDEKGNASTSFVQHAWSKYLNGDWTKKMPSKPGRYTVAHRSGRICGEVLIQEDGGVMRLAHTDDGWDGWYWNEPIPTVLPDDFPLGIAVSEHLQREQATANNKPVVYLVTDGGEV